MSTLQPNTKNSELPEWWPDWMGPPALMAGGYVAPLGQCKECGAQQYPTSFNESHVSSCSRAEAVVGLHRKVPWPRDWTG